jgi:putative metallohydrolase (TIGR04338 family)
MATRRVRDADQQATYAAELQVRVLLDTAVAVDDWSFDFHGYNMTLPMERKFTCIESVRSYIDKVCALRSVRDKFPGFSAPSVREMKKDARRAYYQMGVINVSVENRGLKDPQLRELTVLHELAHHFAPGDAHGAEFRGAFVFLVRECMGQELAMVLGEQFYEQVGKPFAVI